MSDFTFETADGPIKETEDIQLIKPQILMRARREAAGRSRWISIGVKCDGGRVPDEEEGRVESKEARHQEQREKKMFSPIHTNQAVCVGEVMFHKSQPLANTLR